MNKITASPTQLMRQAPSTIASYLSDVRNSLDREFEEGYAKKNPRLVGTLVIACTIDFFTSIIVSVLQDFQDSANA